MSDKEVQDEEREVLLSIYDGDESFKQTSPNTFQYKIGENDTMKSFLLEVKWTDKYPTELPNINLDAFYNKHLSLSLKNSIVRLVSTEAEQYLGMSMTYSIFEFAKERFEELIQEQPKTSVDGSEIEQLNISEDSEVQESSKKLPKKEQLTKSQKRRQWNRVDGKGEKQRGWNWMDVVKHLSQTGSKEDCPPIS